jgi:hypothetical protein
MTTHELSAFASDCGVSTSAGKFLVLFFPTSEQPFYLFSVDPILVSALENKFSDQSLRSTLTYAFSPISAFTPHVNNFAECIWRSFLRIPL